jgi:2-C-methyl-D-erythritol 4-phosphate cytidylyltransferase
MAGPVTSEPGDDVNRSVEPPLPVWGIVLGGGSGHRFGAAKQFVSVDGARLIDLAVDGTAEACDHVVVVLPVGHRWDGRPVDAVVSGGPDRRSSVRRGLAALPVTPGIVVVHQAANPLATQDTFASVIEAVRAGAPAAVPGLRPADIVRRSSDGLAGELLGRDDLVLVQSPAAFRIDVLTTAHALPDPAIEDTMLVSAAGHAVHLVTGDPWNIHVTTHRDLELVRAVLLSRGLRSPADPSIS